MTVGNPLKLHLKKHMEYSHPDSSSWSVYISILSGWLKHQRSFSFTVDFLILYNSPAKFLKSGWDRKGKLILIALTAMPQGVYMLLL